jgi:hypothetical protein
MLPKLSLMSNQTVDIELKSGSEVILSESYMPDENGNVTVEFKTVVEQVLNFRFPESDVFEQTELVRTFNVRIAEGSDVQEFDFVALRGGLKTMSITTDLWLKANFLTWQPQQKYVEYYQPEWLTVYASENIEVRVEAYFNDRVSTDRVLATLVSNKIWTVNTSFARLSSLFSDIVQNPVYFDVWTVRSGTQWSYKQRYILKNSDENAITYIFENSLGGIDSVLFDGMERKKPAFEEKTARYDDIEVAYSVVTKDIVSHQTGYISRYDALWLRDLFGSMKKYRVSQGSVELIISESVNYQVDSTDDLIAFEWSYRPGKESKYMALDRDYGLLPELINVSASADEVVYVAPRLVDFPEAVLDENTLLLVQSPFEQKWYRTNIAEIVSRFVAVASEIEWIDL